MNKKIYFHTLKGKRDDNEDAHNIILNMSGENKKLLSMNYYAIYDGHGGKEISQYLEKNLPRYFMGSSHPHPKNLDNREYSSHVGKIFTFVENLVEKNKNSLNMGSTSLVVMHYENAGRQYLTVINLGDSRCLMCRNGFAHSLTKDHKPHWPEEKERINNIGGKINFDGYCWRIGSLSVSRAFGDVDTKPFVSHTPEVFKYKIEREDKFMVICCDGLLEVMDNNAVINFVLANCYKNGIRIPNVDIAKILATHALKRGSQDNISVIVVFFD